MSEVEEISEDSSEDTSSGTSSGTSEDTSNPEERVDDHVSASKKCPDCGEPIDNLRATCPQCGYRYQESDYDEPEAGTEFEAGAALDESGEEDPDWDPGPDPKQEGRDAAEGEAPTGKGGGESEQT
jgi:hypothetical protein